MPCPARAQTGNGHPRRPTPIGHYICDEQANFRGQTPYDGLKE
jgi:hypothetical protein